VAIGCLHEIPTQVCDHSDEVADSWALHNQDCDVVRHFDENDSCLRSYLHWRRVGSLHLLARLPLRIPLALEVARPFAPSLDDDPVRVTPQTLAILPALQDKGILQSTGV
jgi:hypothetical protein